MTIMLHLLMDATIAESKLDGLAMLLILLFVLQTQTVETALWMEASNVMTAITSGTTDVLLNARYKQDTIAQEPQLAKNQLAKRFVAMDSIWDNCLVMTQMLLTLTVVQKLAMLKQALNVEEAPLKLEIGVQRYGTMD